MIKGQLKRAFIATFAVGAVGAAGCDIFDEDARDGRCIADCEPEPCGIVGCEPDPVCPTSEPAYETPCFNVGQTCTYGSGCDEVYVECTVDGWVNYGTSCNPPPAFCPEERPVVGTACEYDPDSFDGYPSWCEYYEPSPCGGLTTVFGCEYEIDGPVVWAVLEQQDTCALPPERCHEYTDSGQCADDAGCQWLAPGCFDEGGEQPIPLGCYAKGSCANVGCDTWGTCITGIFDPCAGQLCDACGAEATVCAAIAP